MYCVGQKAVRTVVAMRKCVCVCVCVCACVPMYWHSCVYVCVHVCIDIVVGVCVRVCLCIDIVVVVANAREPTSVSMRKYVCACVCE